VGGKHRRKYEHKKSREDNPAPVHGPPSEKADAQHCEAVHQECQKKEEPTKWWRDPEWVKAVAEVILAFFAFASFIALWMQLKDARDNLVRDQRPYLWPSNMIPDSSYEANQKMKIRVFIADYGKSPAMEATTFGNIIVGPNALEKADAWFAKLGDKASPEEPPNEVFLRPGTLPNGDGPMFHIVESQRELTQEDARFIFSTREGKDIGYVVVMRLYYSDTGGNSYHSDICQYSTTTRQLGTCKKHNEVK